MDALIAQWRERLRTDWRHRGIALGAALVLEAIFLAVLLTMGMAGPHQRSPIVVDFKAHESTADKPPEARPKPETADKPSPLAPSPLPPVPRPASAVAAPPAPAPPAVQVPTPPTLLPSTAPPIAAVVPGKAGVVLRNDMTGPPDTGGGAPDTQRVGTAPNGEPMYAAAWYRKPSHDELAGYLSTASGDGWGLIACKTVPDFRVEDCVGLDEYPQGSNYLRAVLAAAWQFRVRPPFKGGQAMIGSWVRIRIEQGREARE